MITENKLNKFEAAKLIEIDDIDAYNTICKKFGEGEDVAMLLLIAHLRRSFNSMGSFSPKKDS